MNARISALITGASGFVGRHMEAELTRRGYSVSRCDIQLGWSAQSVFNTVTAKYAIVVHAAAASPHRDAIDHQPGIFPYNSMLDAMLFEWAIRTKQPQLLYLSSSAVYPQGMQHAGGPRLDEESAWYDVDPESTYGWAKLHGEQMAEAARAEGVRVAVVRPFSGYGEDQGTDWPFGSFLAKTRARVKPFPVWGSASQVRDWIHIDDIVQGALAVVDSQTEQPVNLCTGIGTSMQDLIMMMAQAAGADYWPVLEHHHDKPGGVACRVGDPTRMEQIYKARISLQEGVDRALRGCRN